MCGPTLPSCGEHITITTTMFQIINPHYSQFMSIINMLTLILSHCFIYHKEQNYYQYYVSNTGFSKAYFIINYYLYMEDYTATEMVQYMLDYMFKRSSLPVSVAD